MPPIPMAWHWHSLVARHAKSLKEAAHRIAKALDTQLATAQTQTQQLETVLVRNAPKQPLHPLARIRQSQARWFSTSRTGTRNFTSTTGRSSARFDRSAFPKSRVATSISQSAGRAPFASTLRPNLTGGTLGRTAGGYSHGGAGGARYFSHGPASQAQVVHNVSQAMRAFFTQGHKAQYDGVGPRGQKRYKAVSTLQEETGRKLHSLPRATPGSRLEFAVNPTITALTSLQGVAGFGTSSDSKIAADHLNTSGLLDVLSVDFSRALKDLAAILNDLNRLSALGDLPITYAGSNVVVHFPGCDAESVDRLCDELGVSHGVVVQDEEFDAFAGTEIALLFPFAPSAAESYAGQDLYEEAVQYYDKKPLFNNAGPVISLSDMLTPSPQQSLGASSTRSDSGLEDVLFVDGLEVRSPESEEVAWQYPSSRSASRSCGSNVNGHDPLEYQGFEGIYRFLEELDSARR